MPLPFNGYYAASRCSTGAADEMMPYCAGMRFVGALGDESGAAAPFCGARAPATLGPGGGGHLVLAQGH